MKPEILKASELAELLGCAVTTIEDRARKRELPGLKFGDGGWVFPLQATLAVLNKLAMESLGKIEVQERQAVLVGVPKAGRSLPVLPSL